LCWVETQDEGDADIEADPRDIVYTLDFSSAASTKILATTKLRFSGISFCDDDLALINESWWKTRRVVTSIIKPGNPEEDAKVLFDRNYEDVYNDPGYPVSRRTPRGSYVLARIDGGNKLLLSGDGESPKGSQPFLDILDLESGDTRRLWQSSPPFYEEFVSLFSDMGDEPVTEDGLTVMISQETEKEVSQFYLKTFSRSGSPTSRLMTQFPHPYPHVPLSSDSSPMCWLGLDEGGAEGDRQVQTRGWS